MSQPPCEEVTTAESCRLGIGTGPLTDDGGWLAGLSSTLLFLLAFVWLLAVAYLWIIRQ